MSDPGSKPGLGRFRIVEMAGRGYVIVSPEGARVTDGTAFRPLAERDRAALQAEADRRAGRRERACLCCGARFGSTGFGNRLCDTCRRKGDDTLPNRFAPPRRRTA
jgi:hypothetical protein